jgi:hypothetical protein
MALFTTIRSGSNKVCQETTNAPRFGAFLPLLFELAGDEVARWNRLTDRMSMIVQRLAEQGIVYDRATTKMIDVVAGK